MSKKFLKDRIYRGSYIYSRNGVDYSEEKFEVYREKSGFLINYVSEIISRISTGELLTMTVDYFITKDFLPHQVLIERKLGSEIMLEEFNFNKRTNIIKYQFFENEVPNEPLELQAPSRFYISTPAACSSMIFLKSKKFEDNALNVYSNISSVNRWIYESLPQISTLGAKKFSDGPININVRGSHLSAIEYKITEEDLEQIEKDKRMAQKKEGPVVFKPGIKSFVSKHLTIPYLIQTSDGTKIQIQYLNDFTEKG